MSQHHEEKNLENILPLLLETIEEDDAKLDVEGEHLLLTNTHNTRTPEESTLARAVVSVSVATGETMEEVFTVVYPPPLKAPGGPEIMGCCWMGTTKAWVVYPEGAAVVIAVPVAGGAVPAEVVEGDAEPDGGRTFSLSDAMSITQSETHTKF